MRHEYFEIKDWLKRDFPINTQRMIFSFIIIHIITGSVFTIVSMKLATWLSIYTIWNIHVPIFLTIWGIKIIIKDSRYQLNLFVGIVGLSLSLMNLIIFYDILGVKWNWIFYASIIIYFIIIILCYIYFNYCFKNGYYSKKGKNHRIVYVAIGIIIVIGIFSFKILYSVGSEKLQSAVLPFLPLTVSYCFILLWFGGIYKYYLIKKFS